jgi:hypothetical protein
VTRVLIEIAVEAIAGNDDGVFFEAPALGFFAPGQELQARRLDGREALLLPRRNRGRGDGAARFPAAAGQEED